MKILEWKPVPEKSQPRFLEVINSKIPEPHFEIENTNIEYISFSFYGSFKFMRASDENKKRYFLYRTGVHGTEPDVYFLDGEKKPIMEVNKKSPVLIGESNAILYSKFFLGAVKTQGNRNYIIENLSDIEFALEPSKEIKKQIKENIEEAKITKQDNDGFIIKANLLCGDSLKECEIKTYKNGEVEIKKSAEIMDNIPQTI